jgi:hypothetical protein
MSLPDFQRYLKETDARTDPNLHLYRVETEAMKRLASFSDRAFLAVGLKGIGKTACFLTLQAPTDADVIQPISAETQEPHEIASSRPTLQYIPEIRSELIMQALVALHSRVKNDPKLSRRVPQDAHQELNVLIADLVKKLTSSFDFLGGVTFMGFGISFRNRNKGDPEFRLVSRSNYNKTLALLQKLCTVVRIRLIVDDPEAIFSADEGLNENLVAALAIAADELNSKVPNFKCVVLIKPNVLQALRKVDEFPNVQVRLSWTDEELKEVIRLRAKAANVKLKDVFRAEPDLTLIKLTKDSRSGPRDVLRRLGFQLDAYPLEAVTPETLEKTIGLYSESCFDQMYGPYERPYPGLSRASIILFEGSKLSIPKRTLRNRLAQIVPIRLTQTPARCRVRPRAGIKVGIGRRLNPARNAEQRAERVERVESPVEAERELIEVGL